MEDEARLVVDAKYAATGEDKRLGSVVNMVENDFPGR